MTLPTPAPARLCAGALLSLVLCSLLAGCGGGNTAVAPSPGPTSPAPGVDEPKPVANQPVIRCAP